MSNYCKIGILIPFNGDVTFWGLVTSIVLIRSYGRFCFLNLSQFGQKFHFLPWDGDQSYEMLMWYDFVVSYETVTLSFCRIIFASRLPWLHEPRASKFYDSITLVCDPSPPQLYHRITSIWWSTPILASLLEYTSWTRFGKLQNHGPFPRWK